MARRPASLQAAAGLIALCAILLHVLAAGLLPAAGRDARGDRFCSVPLGGEDRPADTSRHDHHACCLLSCAGCCLTVLAKADAAIYFPPFPGHRIAPARPRPVGIPSPLKLYFSARAPPVSA